MATQWENPLKGVKERILSTGFTHLRVHYSANPLKDYEWACRHALPYGGFDAAKWRREQEIDYKAYGGQRIWPMFGPVMDAHIDIKPLTLFRIIDQGIRHPTVCLWVAVNARGDRHVYREYYSTDRLIAMNCRAILNISEDEEIAGTFIDPSTKKRGDETLTPLIDVYRQNGIYCMTADNSFAGYDKVATAALSTIARNALVTGVLPPSLAKLNPSKDQLLNLADQPALTFDLRFANRSFEECCNHRWREYKTDPTQTAPKETPVDVDDDGPDCVRYAVMSRLYYRKKADRNINAISFQEMRQKQMEQRIIDEAWERNKNRAYR